MDYKLFRAGITKKAIKVNGTDNLNFRFGKNGRIKELISRTSQGKNCTQIARIVFDKKTKTVYKYIDYVDDNENTAEYRVPQRAYLQFIPGGIEMKVSDIRITMNFSELTGDDINALIVIMAGIDLIGPYMFSRANIDAVKKETK